MELIGAGTQVGLALFCMFAIAGLVAALGAVAVTRIGDWTLRKITQKDFARKVFVLRDRAREESAPLVDQVGAN